MPVPVAKSASPPIHATLIRAPARFVEPGVVAQSAVQTIEVVGEHEVNVTVGDRLDEPLVVRSVDFARAAEVVVLKGEHDVGVMVLCLTTQVVGLPLDAEPVLGVVAADASVDALYVT